MGGLHFLRLYLIGFFFGLLHQFLQMLNLFFGLVFELTILWLFSIKQNFGLLRDKLGNIDKELRLCREKVEVFVLEFRDIQVINAKYLSERLLDKNKELSVYVFNGF